MPLQIHGIQLKYDLRDTFHIILLFQDDIGNCLCLAVATSKEILIFALRIFETLAPGNGVFSLC